MEEIGASDRRAFYFKLNLAMYEGSFPTGKCFGSRYIVNGLVAEIDNGYGEFYDLEDFGYPSQSKRLARLKRNYFEQVSHDQARALLTRKFGNSVYTGAPLSFTTNKVKQTGNLGCLVGGAISFKNPPKSPTAIEVDILFRVSETVKVLPADLVFLDRCIRYSTPPHLLLSYRKLRLHFAGAYVVPAFFPQLVAMMYSKGVLNEEGIKLQNNSFGKGCIRALEQCCDPMYRPKWKPQIRIFNFFKRVVPITHRGKVQSLVSLL